jgi:hypothetical protein
VARRARARPICLKSEKAVGTAHAVVLSGGSAYGLAASDGVMTCLESQGIGIPVANGAIVPIVPSAILFDPGSLRAFSFRPDASFGTPPARPPNNGPVQMGNVGAGAGARSGGVKGGLGTASAVLPNGVVVGAIVAVNSPGARSTPRRAVLRGYTLGSSDATIRDRAGASEADRATSCCARPPSRSWPPTLRLTKAQANKVAQMADDGLARAIRPAHGTGDGDTVFALATGTVTATPNINADRRRGRRRAVARHHPRDHGRRRHPRRRLQREQLLRAVPARCSRYETSAVDGLEASNAEPARAPAFAEALLLDPSASERRGRFRWASGRRRSRRRRARSDRHRTRCSTTRTGFSAVSCSLRMRETMFAATARAAPSANTPALGAPVLARSPTAYTLGKRVSSVRGLTVTQPAFGQARSDHHVGRAIARHAKEQVARQFDAAVELHDLARVVDRGDPGVGHEDDAALGKGLEQRLRRLGRTAAPVMAGDSHR